MAGVTSVALVMNVSLSTGKLGFHLQVAKHLIDMSSIAAIGA
jgi:hypothetical protein